MYDLNSFFVKMMISTYMLISDNAEFSGCWSFVSRSKLIDECVCLNRNLLATCMYVCVRVRSVLLLLSICFIRMASS